MERRRLRFEPGERGRDENAQNGNSRNGVDASKDVGDVSDASPPRRQREVRNERAPRELIQIACRRRRNEDNEGLHRSNLRRRRSAEEYDDELDASPPRRISSKRRSADEPRTKSNEHVSATSLASARNVAGSNTGFVSSNVQDGSKDRLGGAIYIGTEGPEDVVLPMKQERKYSFNRYKILAGPRWDGLDRSNGFEQRLEKAKAAKAETEQQAYRMSVSDL